MISVYFVFEPLLRRCCFIRKSGARFASLHLFPTSSSSSYPSFIYCERTTERRTVLRNRMGSIQRPPPTTATDDGRGEFTLELSHRTGNCLPTDRAGATATFKKAKGAFILLSLAIIWGLGKKMSSLASPPCMGNFITRSCIVLFGYKKIEQQQLDSFSVCAHSLLQLSSTH